MSDKGWDMRRGAAIVAMVLVLVGAHLANAWYVDRLAIVTQTFRARDEIGLMAVLRLVLAGAVLLVGWLVLGARRPDAIVATVYVVVGVVAVAIVPAWVLVHWSMPDWLSFVLQIESGLALVPWAGAAIAVIGMAEGVRWVGARLRAPDVTTPAPPSTSEPAR